MVFSIVIPAYDSRRKLQRCLASIRRIDYPDFEVIVVDDGSRDDTEKAISREKGVTYIRQPHQGPAAARNRGFRKAKGELILFTDADCVLPPDILKKYEDYFRDAVLAGAGGSYRTLNRQSRVARYIGYEIAWRHYMAGSQPTSALGTYNAVFRKSALAAIGGFDASFAEASGEDFDLCYRLVEKGYKLAFFSDIFVYHEHPDRVGTYLRQQIKRGKTRTKNVLRHRQFAISDNYVGKSAKWQPLLLFGIIAGVGLLPVSLLAGGMCLALSVAFLLLSNRRLYFYIARQDPGLVLLSIVLSFLKPLAWSLGMVKYWVSTRASSS